LIQQIAKFFIDALLLVEKSIPSRFRVIADVYAKRHSAKLASRTLYLKDIFNNYDFPPLSLISQGN